jgi:hypothetical protein
MGERRGGIARLVCSIHERHASSSNAGAQVGYLPNQNAPRSPALYSCVIKGLEGVQMNRTVS